MKNLQEIADEQKQNWAKMEKTLETLGKIASSFPEDSEESRAMKEAGYAILFLNDQKQNELFLQFMRRQTFPLTGIQILHCKINGIEIPEELRSPKIDALDAEIAELADKIHKFSRPDDLSTSASEE